MDPNEKYGLTTNTEDVYSFLYGRRALCKSVGLKPSNSGCKKALRAAGWKKSQGKDAAIALLCERKVLGSTECAYFQAEGGGEEDKEGINLGMLFLGLFILMALIIGIYFLIKKMRKQ